MEHWSLGFLPGFTPRRYQQRMPGAGTSVEHSLGANRRTFSTLHFGYLTHNNATSRRTRSCQCPHWGVLTKGGATVRYDDGREEVIEPGDIYYMTPGHVPVFAAGTELVMFSPAAEMKATDEAIQAFLASSGQEAQHA